MPIEKKPFIRYKTDEEKVKERSKVFTVRMNKEELKWLEELKEDLNIKSEGKALKIGAFIGKNVLQGLLSRKFLRYLFKEEREKLEYYKNF